MRIFAFIGMLSALGGTLSAAPCTTTTLDQYVSSFGNVVPFCEVGLLKMKLFDFHDVTGLGTITASDIMVTPLGGTAFNFFTNKFNGTFTTPERYIITYLADPAPIVVGDGLELDPPTGGLTVNRYICTDSLLSLDNNLNVAPTGCVPGSGGFYHLKADADPGTPTILLKDSVTFPTAVSSVHVWMVIDLTGPITGFEGLISDHAIPEPATVGFVAAALALGLLRRRRA